MSSIFWKEETNLCVDHSHKLKCTFPITPRVCLLLFIFFSTFDSASAFLPTTARWSTPKTSTVYPNEQRQKVKRLTDISPISFSRCGSSALFVSSDIGTSVRDRIFRVNSYNSTDSLKLSARADISRWFAKALSMYCNHLFCPAIKYWYRDDLPGPQQRAPETLLKGLTALFRAEYLESLADDASRAAGTSSNTSATAAIIEAAAAATKVPDYPSPERQKELKIHVRNIQRVAEVWSAGVTVHDLFEAMARLDLNTTAVFEEKRWSAGEISVQLRQGKSLRGICARSNPVKDLILLDKLCCLQQKLLEPIKYNMDDDEYPFGYGIDDEYPFCF